ncbi:MAG TPA: penicillin-binding protein 2 [Dehalococcoidia bacterium]|nr:penicillin-binding protein 2 [Dehalococcoidia bacterium]
MPESRPNHLTWRLLLLAGLVSIALVALVFRLATIQIVDHQQYADEAAATHAGVADLPAPRGAILDSSGFPLATSEDTWDVYIDRFLWRDAAKASAAANSLGVALGRDAQALLKLGTEGNNGDVVVQRQLPYEAGVQLRSQGLWGVRLLPSSKRVYPEGGLASSIVGFVGIEGTGLWGVESDFDGVLHGKPGLIGSERDALGRPISFGGRTERDPVAGGDVTLTIDRFIQSIAEQRLKEAVSKYNARGGSIVVMDPNTGAILAMASVPSVAQSGINLDDPKLLDEVRNRAITDLYEPGSVIKTLTTATAIDLGRVTPESTYVDTGEVRIGDATIKNWDFSANGPTTVRQYLQKSLNTGSVWLSGLIGAKDFYRYLSAFGLGEPTHIGLSGEADGLIRQPSDDAWYPVDLATNSYGQGFAATPIQVLTAVNVFANGGRLMRPYIVSQVANNSDVRHFDPVEVRRPVSAATAQTMARLMYDVVEGVDYHGARVPGYDVAGKTGTTLVSIPTGYDLNSTIASFAGFIPYQQPRVSILVKIDQPSGGLNLGGQVAAPVFATVAADIMKYLRVPATRPAELQVTAR